MKKILIKLLANSLSDSDNRRKIFIAVLSVFAGFFGLMLLPVAVISGMGEVRPPEISMNFDESMFLPEHDEFTADGQMIAEKMTEIGLREQIIKAQLIYMSYFESGEVMDFSGFASLFQNENDEILISSVNEAYGKNINHNEFFRTYTLIMNLTINEYMFTNTDEKNSADLAAWARNAYVSGWGFDEGCYGEIDSEIRYRCTDSIGLILGYLRYNPHEKSFSDYVDALIYTEQGELDTMPDIQGITVLRDTDFGIYVGDGEVIFASAVDGCVSKSALDEWENWCAFEGVTYSQEVLDRINDIQNAEENEEDDSEETEELVDENFSEQ